MTPNDPASPGRDAEKIQERLKGENRLLSLTSRLLFPRVRPDRPLRRILLFRTARLGDFIVAIPAMVALRKAFPDAEIVLMSPTSTRGQTVHVQRSLAGETRPPWFDFVEPSVVDRVVSPEGDGAWAMSRAVGKEIRAFKPDMTILLSSGLETFRQKLKKLLFFRVSGLRSPIVGYRMKQTEDADVRVQQEAGMLEHNVVSAALSAYECPGMPPFDEDALTFRLDVRPSAREFAERLWTERGWTDRPVVALFPGGSKEHNHWPVAHYARLLGNWPTSPEPVFVALGASSDAAITTALAEASPRPIVDLAGKLSLMELAAVLERCALYLGSNTGPMHLATALGTRTIAIMNHHELLPCWEPWNDRAYGLIHEVPCKGCYDHLKCPLGTEACIRDLPVHQVSKAVRAILDPESGQR